VRVERYFWRGYAGDHRTRKGWLRLGLQWYCDCSQLPESKGGILVGIMRR